MLTGDIYIQICNLKDSSTELKTISKFITHDFYRDEILRVASNLDETRKLLEKSFEIGDDDQDDQDDQDEPIGKVYKVMDSALEQYGRDKSDLNFGRAQGAAKLALELSIITAEQYVVYTESILSLKQDNRISRASARLISSLDQESRYIKFHTFDNEIFTAIVCSSINDEELSDIFTGDDKFWRFTDRDKALRSIRRLNKNVPIYLGVLSSATN